MTAFPSWILQHNHLLSMALAGSITSVSTGEPFRPNKSMMAVLALLDSRMRCMHSWKSPNGVVASQERVPMTLSFTKSAKHCVCVNSRRNLRIDGTALQNVLTSNCTKKAGAEERRRSRPYCSGVGRACRLAEERISDPCVCTSINDPLVVTEHARKHSSKSSTQQIHPG